MPVEVEKGRSQRSRRPQKTRAKANKSGALPEPSIQSADKEPDFPHEWIAVAAYYLWESEGEPEGREAYHWEKAKAELRRLQKQGNLPADWQTEFEER